MRTTLVLAALLSCAASVGLAQDRISAPQVSVPSRDVGLSGQLDAPQPAALAASANQLVSPPSDPLRVNAPPPGSRDACDNYNLRAGPPPEGIECAVVVRPTPIVPPDVAPLTPELIAESGLTAGAVIRPAYQLPNAEDVARRLAIGDISASVAAQAVGSGFGSPPDFTPPSQPRALAGPTVTLPTAP